MARGKKTCWRYFHESMIQNDNVFSEFFEEDAQRSVSLSITMSRSEPDPCFLCHVPHVLCARALSLSLSLPASGLPCLTHWLFQVPGLTHLWLIGPHLFPVPGLTLLLLMKPRFFPVPGHTPVSNWTSSVPVLNRALKNIQCWIISSLTWTPLLPRFPIAFFLPVCFCLDSFGFWI